MLIIASRKGGRLGGFWKLASLDKKPSRLSIKLMGLVLARKRIRTRQPAYTNSCNTKSIRSCLIAVGAPKQGTRDAVQRGRIRTLDCLDQELKCNLYGATTTMIGLKACLQYERQRHEAIRLTSEPCQWAPQNRLQNTNRRISSGTDNGSMRSTFLEPNLHAAQLVDRGVLEIDDIKMA